MDIINRTVNIIWYEPLAFLCTALVAFWIEIFPSMRKFDYNALPKGTGQTVVLTGGNRGIGFEILKQLLQLDYEVIFGARNVNAGLQALKEIRLAGVESGNAKCLALDLMSLASVRKFAETVLKEESRIDLLINNAGVFLEQCSLTEDGYEVHFQVNHLSHFLLTQLLLSKLKATASNKGTNCRVVTVTSAAYWGCTSETLKCLPSRKTHSSITGYMNSKMCQILFTKYQNALLKVENANVSMYAAHPGLIMTGMWASIPVPAFVKNCSNVLVGRTVDKGAEVVLYAAISPDLENNGGQYIVNNRILKTTRVAGDLNIQKQIMELSQRCISGK